MLSCPQLCDDFSLFIYCTVLMSFAKSWTLFCSKTILLKWIPPLAEISVLTLYTIAIDLIFYLCGATG